LALERETKKLHAEVTVLQEELERKSRQASSQLDGDMKSLQRDLTDKTKVCVCLSLTSVSSHSYSQVGQ